VVHISFGSYRQAPNRRRGGGGREAAATSAAGKRHHSGGQGARSPPLPPIGPPSAARAAAEVAATAAEMAGVHISDKRSPQSDFRSSSAAAAAVAGGRRLAVPEGPVALSKIEQLDKRLKVLLDIKWPKFSLNMSPRGEKNSIIFCSLTPASINSTLFYSLGAENTSMMGPAKRYGLSVRLWSLGDENDDGENKEEFSLVRKVLIS